MPGNPQRCDKSADGGTKFRQCEHPLKTCPKCKFLLTDLDASCRYCGQLLRGLDAGEAWTPSEGGVRIDTDTHDSVVRPAAVVRRAGGELRSGADGEHHYQPVAADDIHERSEVTRQHYSIEGQDEPRDSRRLMILVVIVVLLIIAVTLFVKSRGEDPPPEVMPARVSWVSA